MSRSKSVLSEPSESVNVSTIGKLLCKDYQEHCLHIESRFAYLCHLIKCIGMCDRQYRLITGMEIYPLRPSFLEVIPEPLLAGVLAGVCFLFVAIILSLVTACFMSHRRQRRRRKRRQGKTSDLKMPFSSLKNVSLLLKLFVCRKINCWIVLFCLCW